MARIFKHEGEQSWFVADESGVILVDGCPDLDAAIQARQKLLTRKDGFLSKEKPVLAETDTRKPSVVTNLVFYRDFLVLLRDCPDRRPAVVI